MGQLNLYGGATIPVAPAFASAGPVAFVNSTLNDGVDRVAAIIRAPKAGTLHSFEFRQGTNTTPPNPGLRVSFQTPDSSGDPDGTESFFRDITTGFGAGVWLSPPGPITSDGTNTGTKKTVTVNETFCCVVSIPSFVAGSVTISQLDLGGTSVGMSLWNYCDVKAAAFTKNTNSLCMALKYDDGTYAVISPDWYPVKTLTQQTYNNTSTPDERGLYFQLDTNAYINGGWLKGLTQNAADIVLYDGTSVMTSVSVNVAARSSSATGTTGHFFLTSTFLTAGTRYRLVLKPTSASGVVLNDFDVDSNALLAGVGGGVNWGYTQRTDAGAWTDTDTKRPWMGIQIDGIDTSQPGAQTSYAA